ncbi:hypothetical protein GHT06_010665 [Daphnia sinensis]|uniref:Uncharacterized protein n=1 Tax=Daphnia sinensis TaxID=1820382 RepID=A0AAD5PXN3_9CRUS|nr:hypothetical protein GHT06_010665 [Daphnia sinensis]
MIKMKSSSVYRSLREKELLPLPSEETLRKIVSSMECCFGWNELALFNVGEDIKGKPEPDRWCSVMWDEIKLKPDMDWDKRSKKWRGIVDYGETLDKAAKDGTATHCLMFMVRFYKSNGVQVFGVFATKNAASGHILAELIVKSLISLHKVNAIVKNTVCDGSSANKLAYKHLGVNGKLVGGQHYMYHPLDSTSKLFFLFDVPHLLKTTKNNLLKHGKVMICLHREGHASSTVHFKNYEAIYLHEKDKQKKMVPSLSYGHIYPTNFEKMSVRRSSQFFSRHMSIAISEYGKNEKTKHLFQDYVVSAKFTLLMNNVFDVLNGRCVRDGITHANWGSKQQTLADMLNILDNTELLFDKLKNKMDDIDMEQDEDWDDFDENVADESEAKGENQKTTTEEKKNKKLVMFASQTTMEGWRMTIKSAIDLTEECFNAGYGCVLSGKWNQDALERFFGIVRSVKMHPTAKSILHIYRILSLYSSTTKVLNRNANIDQEDQLYNISSYRKCLLDRYKNNTKVLEDLKFSLHDKLLQELSIHFVTECAITKKATVDDKLVYDICGYLMRTRGYLIEYCETCKDSVVCDELLLPDDFDAAAYTQLRTKGGLTFVTVAMFESFRTIEVEVAAHFKNYSHVYKSDTFEVCIDAISSSNIHPIFCESHRNQSLPFLVMEYVHIRYFFESKRYRDLHFSKTNSAIHKHSKVSKCT